MCISNTDDRKLENTVKHDSNTWESFTRSELKLESVHQESPRSDVFRRLIASMPRRIAAVIHAKGGPTKYPVHRNEHNFQKPDISV